MLIRVQYADGQSETWPIDQSAQQQRLAARPEQQRMARYCFKRLRAQPFWPMSSFAAAAPVRALCSALEENFGAIAAEAEALLLPLLRRLARRGCSILAREGCTEYIFVPCVAVLPHWQGHCCPSSSQAHNCHVLEPGEGFGWGCLRGMHNDRGSPNLTLRLAIEHGVNCGRNSSVRM